MPPASETEIMKPAVFAWLDAVSMLKNTVEIAAVGKAENGGDFRDGNGTFPQKPFRFPETELLAVGHQGHSRLTLDKTVQIIAVISNQQRKLIPADLSVADIKDKRDLFQKQFFV